MQSQLTLKKKTDQHQLFKKMFSLLHILKNLVLTSLLDFCYNVKNVTDTRQEEVVIIYVNILKHTYYIINLTEGYNDLILL